MKKITLLAIGALMAGATAFAQTRPASSTAGATRWGLKAGVNLAKYSFGRDNVDNPTSDYTTSAHITGYADVPLARNFSVQPGISLQGKGGEFDFTHPSLGPATRKDDVTWLEIPVNFVGKVPVGAGTSFYFGAGPYAGFAITGHHTTTIKSSGNDNKADIQFGDEPGDTMRGIDLGVNALAGFQLINGINFGAGYGLGLKDLNPNGSGDEGQKNNRVLSFSVGLLF